MVTSPYEWKIPERDENLKQTNKQTSVQKDSITFIIILGTLWKEVLGL